PKEAIDPVRLQAAVDRVVAHHDALRMRFSQRDGQWTQRYADTSVTTVTHEVVDTDALTDACTRAQQSLNLEQGPLLRVACFTLPDGSQRLLIAIHHLVVDGVSWRILLEDLQQAYRDDAPLPARTSSYQTWARRLQQYADSTTMSGEAAFWLAQADAPQPVPDHDVPARTRDAAHETVRLDAHRTSQLLQDAHAAYRTRINDLLLAAVASSVGQWLGHSRVGIVLEGHGRASLFEEVDLSRTVGWFTSVYPIVVPVGLDIGDGIRQAKEALRAVPQQGIGYGLLRHDGPDAVRNALAVRDLPRITFNYLGQFDQGASDPGALFVRADEPSGAGRGPDAPLGNWITINGQVFDGVLEFRIGYSRAQFVTMQPLAEALQGALERVVDHCIAQSTDAQHQSLTPSDLVNVKMDQASLDALLDTVL
ncbi:condensation domain-containing protein, partial [Cupriavidus plantarum]|uniref:condensation domain-containing protein n=1 Tax=Cupriavidus plantarum TaxID=942865 RepID=UPI000F25773B